MTGPSPSLQISQLARDLHRMSTATRRALRRRIEALGQPLLTDARRRAGWSSRIPGAMSVRPVVSSAQARVGLHLRINASAAPHARPYEGLSQGGAGAFRHPVYGNRDVWVSQRTRPSAWPAVAAMGSRTRAAVADAAEDAAREAGFR